MVFGGSDYTGDASSHIVLGDQTLAPDHAVTVSNSVVSLAPDASFAVVGGSTQHVNVAPTPQSSNKTPVLQVGSQAYTALGLSPTFVVGDQTLTPNGAITVSGTTIRLPSGGSYAIVGSDTQLIAPAATTLAPHASFTFDGQIYAASGPSPTFVIDSQTLTPNGEITVSGITVHLAPGASYAVVGSVTETLALTPAAHASYQQLTFGGNTYTASGPSPAFIIASQSLTPNGAITVSGTPIYLPSGASVAVIGRSTQQLAASPSPNPVKYHEITIGSQTYTANSASNFFIGTHTLTPGGVLTINRTPISYLPGATAVVVGSDTQAVATITGGGTSSTATVKEITIGDGTYTANSALDFIVAGHTLTPGSVVTVNGTKISYGLDATDVVVGSKTESVRLGTVIIGGFGNPSQTATQTGNEAATFTGAAGGLRFMRERWGLWTAAVVVWMLIRGD